MAIRFLAVVVVVVGCSKQKQTVQPVDPLPPHATIKPPGAPTGTAVNLQCDGQSTDPCQATDFTFAANYDQAGECRWGGDRALNFSMTSSTSTSATLRLSIASFNGAGTYDITANNGSSFGVDASVTIPAVGTCAGSTGGKGLGVPRGTCTSCNVIVSDANPNAPYPKPLGVSIACRNLCEENAYICTPPINIQLSQTCTSAN